MKADFFQTPEAIAEAILEPIRIRPALIADFAAGHGSLLKAANNRWHRVSLLGTDICKDNIRRIRAQFPDARVGICNFLSSTSRSRCRALSSAHNAVELALLNPPFSCRGSSTVSALLYGEYIRCSAGLAFVINALPYMKSGGRIAAILPAGTMYAEKDADAWGRVMRYAECEVLGWNDKKTFQNCYPQTVMIHLTLKARANASNQPEQRINTDESHRRSGAVVRLYRGNMPMFQIPKACKGPSVPLVHSTELRHFSVNTKARKISAKVRVINGPAVLLPRVGVPNASKVAVLMKESVALSDCVFALGCESGKVAQKLMKQIVSCWPSFERLYTGTGARYLTVAKLADWIQKKGYAVLAHGSASRRVALLLRSHRPVRKQKC